MNKVTVESIEQIVQIMHKEKSDAYQEGLNRGYSAAWRIYIWFAKNHQLVEPHTLEELTEWAENELKTLEELQGFTKES